ncbi:hypothetical protein GQ464_009495 [Rhodocaloribacter litoris]|nr:hypothetical protein GQ464_009495 [Rhodocaloribacter litoris]
MRASAGTLLVYALLTATHLGEFWPFSIYPMFSRGGHPWVRAVVREVPAGGEGISWQTVHTPEALPGHPFPLGETGINQNDIANFVSKSAVWDAQRIRGMRKLFRSTLDEVGLLIYRVEGRLHEPDSVAVTYTPFILLTPDSTYFNPGLSLPTSDAR